MSTQVLDLVYVAFFLAFVISGCAIIYASHAKLEKMEGFLSRSKYINDLNPRLVWAGYYGRIGRLGHVAGCLIRPQFWIKRGLLDPADVADFPKGLKLLAVVPIVAGTFCFAAMGIMIGLGA